jgi:hypothetical protein
MHRSRLTLAARTLACAAMALAAAACSGSAERGARTATPAATAAATVTPVAFGTTQLRAGDRVLRVEVASTPVQSERGLGYRDALAPDAGMIFDLHATAVPVFWMKGMRFPLDMVWIDDAKRVVDITRDVQPQPGAGDAELRRYSPRVPVRYTLEVNAGAAERLGLTPGVQLAFQLGEGAGN